MAAARNLALEYSPYNVFDLTRYYYANGRPSREDHTYYGGPTDFSYPGTYYTEFDMLYNWHGDHIYGLDNWYGPWGEIMGSPIGSWDHYAWNAGWGYMQFLDLGLYYVHGRWYDPNIGRFISPDESGSYIYLGDDGVNKHIKPIGQCATLQQQSTK
jgi:RHS repeat-associated protein